jgi:CheY-like chemotaxis protein
VNSSCVAVKILVVDDDPDAADSLVALLELEHHDTRAANSGEGAVALAATFKPDVVLLDINMPKMDGYATAAALRSTLPADTRLIAFTAQSDPQDVAAAMRAGFDSHVSKPCDFDYLNALLSGSITPR